jgi:formate hydrogenlyase subunit 4
VILFAYLLALGRFFTVAAALDTGSSFEGMGASREAAFSALAEPALFLSLAVLCVPGRTISFEETFGSLSWESWGPGQPAFWAVLMALFLILLAENSRISVDDPNTHLELTMIHEVMVLDHGGPDLAFILHGSAVKLFLFAGLLVHALVPIPESADGWGLFLFVSGEIGFAVLIGMVESVTARLRLPRVPQFLVVLSVIASIGLATVFYRGLP